MSTAEMGRGGEGEEPPAKAARTAPDVYVPEAPAAGTQQAPSRRQLAHPQTRQHPSAPARTLVRT